MKIVLQRVKNASVRIEGQIKGEIGEGLLAFVGIAHSDTKENACKMAEKIAALRIFADNDGKTNLSAKDVNAEILIISQFTLYADCSRGNRPGFSDAAKPDLANELYEQFIFYCRNSFSKVSHGVFGADMQVELINDGPFTVILEN